MATKTDAPALQFGGSIHEGIPVSTEKLDECIKFYTEVLGLKLLPRPKALDQFGPGAWLGDEDDTVHEGRHTLARAMGSARSPLP